MLKRIGYACINLNLKPKSFKECRLNSVYKYGIEYLRKIVINNLNLTKDILDWNINNKIYLYRVTSKLIPLATHPDILKDFSWRWQKDEEILNLMNQIKRTVMNNNIRLTMHPDQFTVLNSLNKDIVKNSIRNLYYHYEVLEKMGGKDITIHVGGVYGDKKASIERFVKNYALLDNKIKKMMRLENDDVSYTIKDVLHISDLTSVPVVLDTHHHTCNNDGTVLNEKIIEKIRHTWNATELDPIVHISSGKTCPTDKRHHEYVNKRDFQYAAKLLKGIDYDLMVEAKNKDKALLRLKNFAEQP